MYQINNANLKYHHSRGLSLIIFHPLSLNFSKFESRDSDTPYSDMSDVCIHTFPVTPFVCTYLRALFR